MPKPGSAPIRAAYDLHCHLLPAWDDGPKTLEDSLAMAARATEAGVECIFTTPHVGKSFRGKEKPAGEIAGAVAALRKELEARQIVLDVRTGAELLLGSVDVMGAPRVRPEWTLNGAARYALVESPYPSWPDFGNHLVQGLLQRGVTPIIAHPERYADVARDISALHSAVTSGALLQITAESVIGAAGKPMQGCCQRLLEAGLVHFVASDAHGASGVWPRDAIEAVTALAGEKRARQIFEDNPRAVAADLPLPEQAEGQAKEPKRGFLSRWRRSVPS